MLLLLANFFWATNWILGRGIHEAFPPVALSFYRWLAAGLILAPLALPRLRGKWHLVREHWWLFLILGGTGVATFQAIIYVGLNYTTAINATILNAATPLIMVLMVWGIEGQAATRRQWLGMALTFLGVLLIVSRGEWQNLRDFPFQHRRHRHFRVAADLDVVFGPGAAAPDGDGRGRFRLRPDADRPDGVVAGFRL